MKENQVQQDLASIRNLMERSSKFISLSGLSGILAGIYALIGSAFIYWNSYFPMQSEPDRASVIIIAAVVLLASVITGIVLSARKAKRKGQQIWGPASRLLSFHMAGPLLTGGILIIIFFYKGNAGLAAPASLIFYGLALLSASNFTFTDIKYLGLSEIALGLIAAMYPGSSLLLWAFGFGVLHIVYGSIMYLKYDR
jgi:hypothetical protein